jgi:hypothetical protein
MVEFPMRNFEGEKEMRSINDKSFKYKKTYARPMLNLAIGFLLYSFIVLLLVFSNAASEQQFLEGSYLANVVSKREVISVKEEKEIEKVLKSSPNVSEVSIFSIKDFENEDGSFTYDIEGKTPVYYYKKPLWVLEGAGVRLIGAAYAANDPWYLDITYRSFEGLLLRMFLIGAISYWTLFSSWASINAYHQKRFKIGWFFAFVFFNVIGYWLYNYVNRDKTQKKISFLGM